MLERFPHEIFRQIIQISNIYEPFQLSFSSTLILPPIAASHVCRSWRTVLLSDPTMWTCLRIPHMSSDVIHEMLCRSKSATLELYVELFDHLLDLQASESYMPNVLPSIFKEMRRFRVLQINFLSEEISDEVADQIFSYLRSPAPILQTFCLHIEGKGETAGKKFLQTLFAGFAPNLKHLNIPLYVDFSQTLSYPLFRDLYNLHLHEEVKTVISGDILLELLELSPCLHVFELGWRKSNPTTISPVSSDRQIHLPRLRQLYLAGNLDIANLFLKHVVFPFEDTFFYILVPSVNLHDFYYTTPLVRFLARRRLTFLSLCPIWNEGFVELFERYPRGDWNSTFIARYNNTHDSAENLLNCLRVFELSNITHLHLMTERWEYRTFNSLFVMLVNLEYLCVDHSNAHRTLDHSLRTCFLRALIPHYSNPPEQPGLDQQIVNKTHLVSADESGPGPGPWYTDPSKHMFPCSSLSELKIDVLQEHAKLDEQYAQMLSVCSYIRCQAGRPFKSITIRCHQITEGAKTWLEPHEGFPITLHVRSS